MIKKYGFILPSIFNLPVESLDLKLKPVLAAGAECVHYDVMDGTLTSKFFDGFKYLELTKNLLQKYDVESDIHLVASYQQKFFNLVIKFQPSKVSIHYESKEDVFGNLKFLKLRGIKAGLAINLNSYPDVDELAYLNPDYFHLIANSEQTGIKDFQNSVLIKAANIKKVFPDRLVTLDCGVKEHHIIPAQKNGVDHVVIGSAIFENPDPGLIFKKMSELILKKNS